MPWRVIAHGDQVWHVDALAERPANAEAWQLVLSFRSATERSGRSFWTLYPLEATSKSSLFIQAERIPDGHHLVDKARHLGSYLEGNRRSGPPAAVLPIEELMRDSGRG